MGQQGEALAKQVEDVVDQIVSLIETCPDAKWTAKTAAEGWGVNATARHVGGHLSAIGVVQAIASGAELPPLDMNAIDQGNAQAAQEHANCTKADAIGFLKEQGAGAASALRALSDADLAKTTAVMGAPMPASALAHAVLIQSSHEHLASLKAATS